MVEDLSNDIIRIIKEVLKTNTVIKNSTNLTDLAIDSINFIEIAVAIEQKYHFEFDDSMLNYEVFKTVQSIVSYVDLLIKK